MKADLETYEWIERYLNHELQGSELLMFEARRDVDKDFASLVEAQKAANTIITGNRLMEVKQLMDKDFAEGRPANTGHAKWWWGTGALVVTVLVFTTLYLQQEQGAPVVHQYESEAGRELRTHNGPYATDSGEHKPYTKSDVPEKEINNTKISGGSSTNADAEEKESESANISDKDSVATNRNDLVPVLPYSPVNEESRENKLPLSVCHNVKITAEVIQQPACTGNQDGSIRILTHTIKGGSAPYHFILIAHGKELKEQEDEEFGNLLPGNYMVQMRDINQCVSDPKPVSVGEKNCSKNAPQSFSPSLGETFHFPAAAGREATVTVLNQAGNKVCRVHLGGDNQETWNGTDQYGQNLPPALYIYIIEYTNGQKDTGEIIIY